MKRFLIDLDGTLYRGEQPVEYAATFIDWLNASGIGYLLVTNCPLHAPQTIARKLTGMGIDATTEKVLSCSMATVDYLLRHQPGKSVFLLGSQPFRELLLQGGIELRESHADLVVVGHNPHMTYQQLAQACHQVSAGATLVAANMDNVIPSGDHFVPHTGAIVQAISFATGQQPVVVGKPMGYMLDTAARLLDCPVQDCIVIGDRLDTDMLFAQNNGLQGYLVLTGYTTAPMLAQAELTNVSVFKNLGEIMRRYMEEERER